MSFTQTVLQHHRDCKVENTAAMPTLTGAADAADYFLCVVEALAEHLGGAEHRDKGVEVFLMDKCLQLQCLAVGEGRIDHVVGPVGIGTVAGRIGRAAHQLAHDEVADGVFVVADDEDGLAHLHLLEDGIDDEALDR